ncbi:MAG: M15 family metallopeptidase [Clostridium sp.]|nr:M15 family metallopeptidase [Prevotella sp.]MCM1429326.1 M15 family metallopeptidase [Clostridium sp.]MCM1475640.1 M15 family metallopeptidase [Muribaculaceae bacterium]
MSIKKLIRKSNIAAAMLLLFVISGCNGDKKFTDSIGENRDSSEITETQKKEVSKSKFPLGIQALQAAYPDFIGENAYEDGKLILKDGTVIVYDDGTKKGFEETLDNCDIEDMFTPIYEVNTPPAYQFDPGRQRNEELFKKMYGNNESAVRNNLVSVKWIGETVKFNSQNGAADSLRAVAAELEHHPELHRYLKSSGTFLWRPVRGTSRLSAHSYGIAFDVGVEHADYWRWKNPGANENSKVNYVNKIPHELVEIFERHGFIWGGAWYHFDTMHFEFRPDLLIYRDLNR